MIFEKVGCHIRIVVTKDEAKKCGECFATILHSFVVATSKSTVAVVEKKLLLFTIASCYVLLSLVVVNAKVCTFAPVSRDTIVRRHHHGMQEILWYTGTCFLIRLGRTIIYTTFWELLEKHNAPTMDDNKLSSFLSSSVYSVAAFATGICFAAFVSYRVDC